MCHENGNENGYSDSVGLPSYEYFYLFLFIHGSECFIDVFLIVFTFYTLSLVRLGRHNCLPLSPSSLGFLHIIYCAAIEFEFVDLLMGTANTNWAHVES